MRTKKNRPVKARRAFQGIAISIERPKGSVVPWESADGTKGETVYTADYGFFPGKLAIDGDSLDTFVGSDENAVDAFIMAQCKSGKVEQPKVMLGFGTYAEARTAFDAMRWPGAYGGCAKLSVESLRTQLDTWNGFLDVEEVIDFPAIEPDEDEEPESGPQSESAKATRADDVTNFPKQGDDKKVSLRNSQWSVFDVSFMEKIKADHPEVWKLGGNIEGNAQFRRLVPIAKRGGYPVTETEEYAIRLREAWGARHKENKLPAGVVALGKWLVVGSIGESAMKKIMNEQKAKKAMNDARKQFSQLVRSIAAAALAAGTLAPEVRDAILPFARDTGDAHAAKTRPDGLRVRTIHVRAVREDAREVDFVASTETVDSYGEIVKQNWRLERFRQNPVILFAHDSHSLPIGHASKFGVENGALLITVKFSTARANPFAELCFQSVLEKALRGGSVGFKPHSIRYEMFDDVERCVLDDNELYEFSVCPIPSNPDGLAQLESRMAAMFKTLSAAATAAPKPTTKQEGRMPDPKKKTLGDAEVEALRTRGMCKINCDCGNEMAIEMPSIGKMDEENKALSSKVATLSAELEATKKAVEDERKKAANEKRSAEVGAEIKLLVDEGKLLADDVDDLVALALEKPERYAKRVEQIRERAPLNARDLTQRPNLGGEPEHQRGSTERGTSERTFEATDFVNRATSSVYATRNTDLGFAKTLGAPFAGAEASDMNAFVNG